MKQTPYPSRFDNDEENTLKELFVEFKPDDAPAAIKQTVMSEILLNWAKQPTLTTESNQKLNYLWIIPITVIICTGIYFIDIQPTSMQHDIWGFGTTVNPLQNVALNLKRMTEWFAKVPPLVVYISIVTAFLLTIDQLIGKLKRV